MKIILLTHPEFLHHQSMSRYANWLREGLLNKGHDVEIWCPKNIMSKLPILKKWFGYVDQFVLFPLSLKNRINKQSDKVLYVFTDHALGPWIPYFKDKTHIIHCHDFLAQKSALGLIKENPTKLTGKLYQKYIRSGFIKGKNFISISYNTQKDLHFFLKDTPDISEVVYNGLNQNFKPLPINECRNAIANKIGRFVNEGYFLHIGGNMWYKNRAGVLKLYEAWRKINTKANIPLIMIGARPDDDLKRIYFKNLYKKDIYFITDASNELLKQSYCGALVLLFPSLAEGFGWPIAEAMASGCLVLTTNEAPMNEVAADAAVLIDRYPVELERQQKWAFESSKVLDLILKSENDKYNLISKGYDNVNRFNSDKVLNDIEAIYKRLCPL